ncbi:tetratricopeptide repeat protein [Kordia jejudonensis]|uniref:tetratricopeptide repeat protein n=1 Tax=Kordia jejudonensis TaxID=1348245 RepID=UPI000629534F|nr:tetratricopeptide repeat protein [Kordia jejudonensis]
MKILCFILFSSLSLFVVDAQNEMKQPNDSLRNFSLAALKNLVETNLYENPKRAKTYVLAYYSKAVAENDNVHICESAYATAQIYSVLEQKDSAHYYVDIAIENAEANSHSKEYINSLYLKGSIFYDSDKYDEASDMYAKVYELAKEGNDIAKLAEIRHSIALIKNQVGQPKQAASLAKKNLQLYQNAVLPIEKYPMDYLNTLINLSNTYTNLATQFPKYKVQYLDSAQSYNTKGLENSLVLNDMEGNSIFLTLQAIIQQTKGNYDAAAADFIKVEKQINTLGFQNQLTVLYLYMGKNFFLQNEYDTAIRYLEKVIELVNEKDVNSPSIQETYILLAKSYEQQNNTEKALEYFKLYEEKDAVNDILKHKVSEKIYKEYDVSSFKTKIEKLRNESQQQEKKSRTLTYISLGLAIISIFGFYYYKRRERVNKDRFDAVLQELKAKETTQDTSQQQLQNYVITDENIQKILKGLERFEAKKMFLQKKCSLNYVAKKINTNSTYLSKTLQSHKQKKFVQYITDLRLDYVLVQLKNDSKFRTYDIKSIASELGFRTSESFSKAFKKRTGIYPSYYIKNLNKITNE